MRSLNSAGFSAGRRIGWAWRRCVLFRCTLSPGGCPGRLNQTVCALRFFYGVTLNQPELPERIPYARQPRGLPVVLSADEVVRFLEAVSSLKNRTALTTAYAAGLRAAEAARLKPADIDSDRKVIRVEHGKGGKSLPRRRPGAATSCCRRNC